MFYTTRVQYLRFEKSPELNSHFFFFTFLLQIRSGVQRDSTKPAWDAATHIPVTVPVPVRRSPLGGAGAGGGGIPLGSASIRVTPSHEETLGGSEKYLKSLRKSEGVYSVPYDRTDDSQMHSTYDAVSTYREGSVTGVSVADHTSNNSNIEQKYSALEKEVLEARKRLQLNELNTEDESSKKENKLGKQNFELGRIMNQSKGSEGRSNPFPEIPYMREECGDYTEIQNRHDECQNEVQVEVDHLLERKEGMMGEEETKAVSGYEVNEALNRRDAAEREREMKINEEKKVVIEEERQKEIVRVQKEKEREEEKEQVREREKERERETDRERKREREMEMEREREREREEDIERDRAREREREREIREKKEKERRMTEMKEREEEKEQVREREREKDMERDRAREREREIREKKEKEKWMVEEKEMEEEKEQVNRDRERSRERERENERRDKEEEGEKAKELSEKRRRGENEKSTARIEERGKESVRERVSEHCKETLVGHSSGKVGEMKMEEVHDIPQVETRTNNLDANVRQSDAKKVIQIEKLDMNEEKKERSEDEYDDEDDEESKQAMSFSMRSTGSRDFSSTFHSAENQRQDDNDDEDKDEDESESKKENENKSEDMGDNESDNENENENYSVVENDFDEQIVKEAVMRELKERNLRLGAGKDLKVIIPKDLGPEIPRNKNEDFKHDDNVNYISSEWVSVIENKSEIENVMNTKHQDGGLNPVFTSHNSDKQPDKDERYTNKMELSTNSEVWLDHTCSVDEDKKGRIGSDMVLEHFDGLNTQELLASSTSGLEKGESKSEEVRDSSMKTQQTAVTALEQAEITKKSADDLAISEARASVILRRKLKLEKDALAASLSSLPTKGSEKPESAPVSASMPSSISTSKMMKSNTSEDSPQEDEDENEDENDDDDNVMNESKSVVGVSSCYITP